ncbi:unnamed protein product [Closterium sp. Yama58-4]|nr:unnamed protein product [Closterium sp. Yama58-4]
MAVASARACTSSTADYPLFAEALRAWRSREGVNQPPVQVEVTLSPATARAVPCEPTLKVEATVESTFESPSESTYQAIPEEISELTPPAISEATCESTHEQFQLQVTLSSAPATVEVEDSRSDCEQTSSGSDYSKETISVSSSNDASCDTHVEIYGSTGARVKVGGVEEEAWNARGGALAHQKPTASSMRQQQEIKHALKCSGRRNAGSTTKAATRRPSRP